QPTLRLAQETGTNPGQMNKPAPRAAFLRLAQQADLQLKILTSL
ncbi:hypothetical protein A2U01_0089946, partial [Trifolium medium]|nr:hypothetical protein [Trifolium medium]